MERHSQGVGSNLRGRHQPAGSDMQCGGLRDHARSMLQVIGPSMHALRPRRQRAERPTAMRRPQDLNARRRARHRSGWNRALASGLLTAEYRALRARFCAYGARIAVAKPRHWKTSSVLMSYSTKPWLSRPSRYCDELIKTSDFFIGILGHDLRLPPCNTSIWPVLQAWGDQGCCLW